MKNYFEKDKLKVSVFDTRSEMGQNAANDIIDAINKIMEKKSEVNIIFAAAPSQNEVLASLVASGKVDWTRVNAFHMDEYIGLSPSAPQRFGNFLNNAIFKKLPFKSINYIDGGAKDINAECEHYSLLLKQYPADIVCMGIGENGHIAFNDPPVADFNDSKVIKSVKLDQICRNQQVHDGCFKTVNDVPTHALTLTVPTLFGGKHLFCVVPAATKANAVYEMINGSIDEHCPATILRKHPSAHLYCDKDSASLLK